MSEGAEVAHSAFRFVARLSRSFAPPRRPRRTLYLLYTGGEFEVSDLGFGLDAVVNRFAREMRESESSRPGFWGTGRDPWGSDRNSTWTGANRESGGAACEQRIRRGISHKDVAPVERSTRATR